MSGQLMNTQALCASAWGSGKLILLGEHAVVYGHPALAVALPQGLQVTVTVRAGDQGAKPMIQLSDQGVFAHVPMKESALLLTALNQGLNWARQQGLELTDNYVLTVNGTLPFKVGLGSSAALSVATLRALAKLVGHRWSNTALFAGAMVMENVFHQTPSGLDHQVSIQGGALRFQRQEPQAQFTPISLARPLHLVLTWGPRQGTTADAVSAVAQRHQSAPTHYTHLFQQINALTQRGLQAIEYGDLATLGETLNDNHQALEQLGVVTPALNQARDLFIKAGALGAKMSGAGHGGTCFGLFESVEQAQRLSQQLTTQTIPCWQVTLA